MDSVEETKVEKELETVAKAVEMTHVVRGLTHKVGNRLNELQQAQQDNTEKIRELWKVENRVRLNLIEKRGIYEA